MGCIIYTCIYCVEDWSRIIAELSPGFTDGIYGRRHIDGGLRDES